MTVVDKMVYTHKEIKEKYDSDYQIQKAVKNGDLYKIESGIYSDKENNHYLDIFVKKYPNASISGDSAYYYHNLTDVIPKKIFMTTDRTSGSLMISTSFSHILLLNILIKYGNLNKIKLEQYINKIIFSDKALRVNNFKDIYKMVNLVFNNRRFVSNLSNVKVNWLDVATDEVVNCVLEFIRKLEKISI